MRALHRSCLVLSLLLSLSLASTARAVTVEQIPSPRPAGWTVDLTGTLSPERLTELDRLGDEVKSKTGAEMAVVVVSSTDGVDAQAFATRLFNTWGIGQRGKGDGLLVFAALADHRAEIVLGRGLDDERNRRESATVMQENIIPRFRAGDPAGAVVQGALGCARRLLGVSPLLGEVETIPEVSSSSAPIQAPAPPSLPQPEPFPYVPPPTPPQAPAYVYKASSDGIGVPGLIGMGILGSLLLVVGLFVIRDPRCPKCKEKMTQLDEQADDAYLQPSEKVEERIGSVDYQIWVCPACGERKKRRGSAFFSRYQTCPECGAKTLSSTSRTVEQATYHHGGLVEVQQTCANCSYKNSYTRSTPMLEDRSSYSASSSSSASSLFSSSSPSSSSSSTSSSDFSSSSSSSSSSGFSGGDSSGGGASGSW